MNIQFKTIQLILLFFLLLFFFFCLKILFHLVCNEVFPNWVRLLVEENVGKGKKKRKEKKMCFTCRKIILCNPAIYRFRKHTITAENQRRF